MTPDFTFIVNPCAARGKGAAVWSALQPELDRRKVRYEMLLTGGRGEAMRLARESGSGTIVAVGGDGTINEVLNGIGDSGKFLGVIPAGSGNDFIKSVGIPPHPLRALEILLSGEQITIDTGRTYIGLDKSESTRLFCNGVGIGFDAEVASRTAEVKRFQGLGVYILAVLKTLGAYDAPDFSLQVDETTLTGRRLLIAIGNGPCAGGGFYLTPRATVTDGLLDVCAIEAMGTASILGLMPRVMRGKHLALKEVSYQQGRTIDVRGDRPFSVHADGEMIGRGITRIRIDVVAGAIGVIGAKRAPAQ